MKQLAREALKFKDPDYGWIRGRSLFAYLSLCAKEYRERGPQPPKDPQMIFFDEMRNLVWDVYPYGHSDHMWFSKKEMRTILETNCMTPFYQANKKRAAEMFASSRRETASRRKREKAAAFRDRVIQAGFDPDTGQWIGDKNQ